MRCLSTGLINELKYFERKTEKMFDKAVVNSFPFFSLLFSCHSKRINPKLDVTKNDFFVDLKLSYVSLGNFHT